MSSTVGFPYYEVCSKPTNTNNVVMPGATLNFYFSGTLNPAPVYADGALQNQLMPTQLKADGSGQFPAIYLNPAITYRRELFDQNMTLQKDNDPINSPVVGQIFAAAKLADTTRSTSSATVDPELAVNLISGTYNFTSTISALAGGGLQIGINSFPAAATGTCVYTGVSVSAGGGILILAAPLQIFAWDTSTSGSDYLNMQGTIIVTAPTVVGVYWGCIPSGSTIVHTGSSLAFTKIA